MKFTTVKSAICLILFASLGNLGFAQDLVGVLNNDVRNTFSQQPAGSGAAATTPAQYPPQADYTITALRATGHQFRSTTAVGGWLGHRIVDGTSNLLAGPEVMPLVEGPTTLKLPEDANGLKLGSVSMGRGLVGRTPDAYFGDVLPPPSIDDQGNPVDGSLAFYSRPHNVGDFYFSEASQLVFASQAGTAYVEWRMITPDPDEVRIVPVQYVVAASVDPAGTPARVIYWTQNGYSGIPVDIPSAVKLNIRYNRQVPRLVAEEFASPFLNQPNRHPSQLVFQTLWYTPSGANFQQEIGGQLNAYNLEGLVLLELLDANDAFIGTQVVQIRRESNPTVVDAYIGDRLFSDPRDEALKPVVVAGLGAQQSFVDFNAMPSRNEFHVYATRTTTPFPPDQFGNRRASGEVKVFWLERSLADIEWPMIYNSYIVTWPDTSLADAYTTFLRQNAEDGDSAATSVLFPSGNRSVMLFQDDPFGIRAVVDDGNRLHFRLGDVDGQGFALIRHSNGENYWYERVHAVLATNLPSYTTVLEADVGKRLLPPPGLGLDDTVGYVRLHPTDQSKRKFRSAYDPTAFIDPFSAGFEEAKKGAIIPVNARSGFEAGAIQQDELEVWWYKVSNPPEGTTSLQPYYYPVHVALYQCVWPQDAEKIVLASNKGSGSLPSVQATGRIYFENDENKVGFNPNDEHGLMLGGSAWALRDDLGTRATSLPYVLVRYDDPAVGRPAMRVFKVMREDYEANPPITFTYDVEAGKVLQPPMPMPLLGVVFNRNQTPANFEEPAVRYPAPANLESPEHYNRYTYTDRKGTLWVYRGPHNEGAEGDESFSMKYYYPAQTGFYVPGLALNQQPGAGDPMPYLRRFPQDATDAELETFAQANSNRGISQQPLAIIYTPRWPAFAPTMRMGETATVPRFGIPAVRGQTSVRVLYEQAGANDPDNEKSSVTLIDPTVGKSVELHSSLTRLPDSVVTDLYQGKYYFPNLPPHLSERFFFDPNRGSKGSLVLEGRFMDEILGAKYLHLNLLTAKDMVDVKALCVAEDNDKSKWDEMIDSLEVEAVRYVPNTAKPGTVIAVPETPPALLAAKLNSVWNYIESQPWRNRSAPPTQSQIASGSGVASSGNNLDLATAWIGENFAALVSADQKRAGVVTDPDQDTLRERVMTTLMAAATDPAIARLFSAARQADKDYLGTTYQWMSRVPPSAWAQWETWKASATALTDWILTQPWSTPAGMGLQITDARNVTGFPWTVSALAIQEIGKTVPLFPSGTQYVKLYDNFYFDLQQSGTPSPVTVEMADRAWDFVVQYRAQLVQWHASRLDPTSHNFAFGQLEKSYRNAETVGHLTAGVADMVEITHEDVAVDSYALSADGGAGYVTLIMGNGRAFSPAEEPVSMYVIRVEPPLSSGEIKVVQSSNPLAEKLTMQSSNDFAGKPEQYEFEWKTLPPVDGLPPPVYSFTRQLVMGDGSWFPSYENPEVTDPATVSLPSNVSIAGAVDENGVVEAKPLLALTRQFNLAALPYRAFVSFTLGAEDGIAISVNGTAVAFRNYPDTTNSVTANPPLSTFQPLQRFVEIPISALRAGAGTVNEIRLDLVTGSPSGTTSLLNCRLESMIHTDLTATWNSVPTGAGEVTVTQGVQGKNRFTIEGQSLFTLTDNYFIYRYRALNDSHDAYDAGGGGWSNWTEPQLGEGWIKRALAGINPFEQRIKDLFSNSVNLDVSMITQAGRRWEGDVALNLANINDYGLIEIYETILRRGKGLSIEGSPGINYGPANDALLLAAGYLNDLYMILGNEAYADAQNPTIAYGTDSGQLGDTASAQFAFKGQLATVLDEELALLRGRDDFFAPGTRVTPVFNRLIWNYTRGINSGEVVYALNYNIKDLNGDGSVNAEDAAQAYPQGHGDAYGHYLMALKNYYSLLWNPNFDWIPRIEAVLVLGKPVSVDYMDERKFAGAAAAWSRTTSQIVDLTYRQSYQPGAKGSSTLEGTGLEDVPPTWAHLGNVRSNSNTGVTRKWGMDDWAVRGGQGAFFHWLSSNAMLPETDPDPTHEGIQKIDRTTVPEIGEIASQAESIQRLLDNADQHLNPLGLSDGAIPFDIAVSDQGPQFHYEQVYARALGALGNANAAFDRAKGATALLRSQDESLDAQRDVIYKQERAFEAQLIDLYGTPYADDIGPGKTYAQGYTGPDLYHYMYIDMPELLHNSGDGDLTEQKFWLVGGTSFKDAFTNLEKWNEYDLKGTGGDVGKLLAEEAWNHQGDNTPPLRMPEGVGVEEVTYVLDSNGQFRKPANWTGRRYHPGAIQQAISEVMMARIRLNNELGDHAGMVMNVHRAFRLYKTAVDAHFAERRRMVSWNLESNLIDQLVNTLDFLESLFSDKIVLAEKVADAAKEATPKVNGTSNDTTSAIRAAIAVQEATTNAISDEVKTGFKVVKFATQTSKAWREKISELEGFDIAWTSEHLGMITDLKEAWEALEKGIRPVDKLIRAYEDAHAQVRTLIAQGDRIQKEREFFRRRSAAIVHGYRTKDLGFRIFRDEALESYRSLFDLASRYTFMAARAYDYETGLLDSVRSSTASTFMQDIVKARAVGVFSNGIPQVTSSSVGDPGLAGALARMNGDWSVAKHRFGLNNPARNQTVFSLRREAQRIDPGPDGDVPWRDYLATCRRANLLLDTDVRRHCLNINPRNLLTVPGYVIEFSTTIEEGVNFFGRALMGGDQTFSPSAFANKIRGAGIGFKGYIGMASPTTIGGVVGSPNDPGTGFTDPNAMSATPYVYLIPSGLDVMRAPSNNDVNVIRSWSIEDQAIPLPFDIGGSFSSANVITGFGTLQEQFTLRKHGAFRAVPGDTVFSSGQNFTTGSSNNFTSTRLISRSVWNSRWKIVIPGGTLLAEPINGMAKFLQQVKDIQIYLDSYSVSGN